MKNQLVFAVILTAFLSACNVADTPPSPYETGAYIINRGNFSDNNGTVSYLPTGAKTAQTDIFNLVNLRPLTGGVQDYTESDGKGLILVDNSTAGQDKIEIVEAGTFRSLATLAAPDIENPRQVLRVSANKIYVSCWGATGSFSDFYPNPGYIAVINLASNTITKRITVGKGPEQMTLLDGEVFVGYTDGTGEKTVTVINTTTDSPKTPSIDVGTNASPVGIDANGKLWIYANKEMIRVNVATKAIETRLKVGTHPSKTPSSIVQSPDKQQFYFVYAFYDAADGYKRKGETYRFSISDAAIASTTPFINRLFEGLGIDPKTGNIYAGVVPSYKQAGYVLRYEPTGKLIDSVKAEIAPTKFFFK
jgi:hypothetical protein